MRRYVNPTMDCFKDIANSEIYVDKTELIEFTNSVLNTYRRCVCNSRPRRFGKTFTASMLEYYYSKSFDADAVFSNLKIGKSPSYKNHLNKHNVIHLDIQECKDRAGGYDRIADYIQKEVIKELREIYPHMIPENTHLLAEALLLVSGNTGDRFIIIIDEWDAVIRDENATPEITNRYYEFLRSLFKGSDTTAFLSLAFLTGILPIKRVKGQSALNEFWDYTMTAPDNLSEYIGFTEEEVRSLCTKYNVDFGQMARWYDGYKLCGYHIYNPVAVVKAISRRTFKNYWSNTGLYESVTPLIDMNYQGLKNALVKMLAGEHVDVDVTTFSNDVAEIRCKDHVLTYLIHLGYLAYDSETRTAYIPNEEIREEIVHAVKDSRVGELIDLINDSDTLLEATLRKDADAVAEMIADFHLKYTSVIRHNDENSLSSVLMIAYISALNYYTSPTREMPTGEGYADFVYMPKPEYISKYPAMIMELKYGKSAEDAIHQIYRRKYATSMLKHTDHILLVGINYNKDTKKHECLIETYNPDKKMEADPLDAKTKQAINAMAESGMLTADIISITHVPAELVYDYLGYIDMKGYRFDMKKIRSIMPSFGQNDVEQFLSEYFDEYKRYGTPI